MIFTMNMATSVMRCALARLSESIIGLDDVKISPPIPEVAVLVRCSALSGLEAICCPSWHISL
jgi:hypothetical protein